MTTWDLLNEHWDSLGDWNLFGTGTSEINPVSQLHQKENAVKPSHIARWKNLVNGLPTAYTSESKLKIDDFSLSGYHRYEFNDGEHVVIIRIKNNQIECYGEKGTYNTISLTTQTGIFYIWRFVINSIGEIVDVYRDNLFIGSFTSLFNYALNDGQIWTDVYYKGEVHEDYWRIASGLHEPIIPVIAKAKIAGKPYAFPKKDLCPECKCPKTYVYRGSQYRVKTGPGRIEKEETGKTYVEWFCKRCGNSGWYLE